MRAFHDFARVACDIADDADMGADDKLARLMALDAVFVRDAAGAAPEPAARLRAVCDETGVSVDHARRLLQACIKAAANRPIASWGELLTTCQFSAAPVGRFLLDLHGEERGAWRAADALCAALQILDGLGHCRADYVRLGRAAMPADWLRQAGASAEELGARRASPALSQVIGRMLDGVERLLVVAHTLPGQVADRRLRVDVAVALARAKGLARLLRRRDPVMRRVTLGRLRRLACTLRGLGRGLGRGLRTRPGPDTFDRRQ